MPDFQESRPKNGVRFFILHIFWKFGILVMSRNGAMAFLSGEGRIFLYYVVIIAWGMVQYEKYFSSYFCFPKYCHGVRSTECNMENKKNEKYGCGNCY